ncbi:MAG: hypothetical protein ACM3QV_00040, partial [Caulobacteraceae bacterium]
MNDSLYEVDSSGLVTDMNPVSFEMHGFNRLDDARRPLEDYRNLLDVTDANGIPLAFEEWPYSRAMRGELFSNQIVRVRRKDTNAGFIGS